MSLEISDYSKKQYTNLNLKEVAEKIVSKIPEPYLSGIAKIELIDNTPKGDGTALAEYIFEHKTGIRRIAIYLPNLFKRCNDRLLNNEILVYLMIGHCIGHELGHHQSLGLGMRRIKKHSHEEYEANSLGVKIIFDVLRKLFPFSIHNWILQLQLRIYKDRYAFVLGVTSYPIEWEEFFKSIVQMSIYFTIIAVFNLLTFFVTKQPLSLAFLNLVMGILYVLLAVSCFILKDNKVIYRIIITSTLFFAEIAEFILRGTKLLTESITEIFTFDSIATVCICAILIYLINYDIGRMKSFKKRSQS